MCLRADSSPFKEDSVRNRYLGKLLSLLCVALMPLSQAMAQTTDGDYPTKLIKMVIPFPPGQLSDSFGRVLADELRASLGQPVMVENRPGQAGSIAVAEFARVKPDGYTILLGATAAFAANTYLYKTVRYDALKDFQPVTMMSRSPLVLLVNPKLPVKNLRDLVKIMREEPNRLNYGSSGYGTIGHMTMEALKLNVGGGASHIPYPGIAGAYIALMSGDIDVFIDATQTALPHIETGKALAIATPMKTRHPKLPNIPTFEEEGVAGVDRTSWASMFVPAGTPKPIVDRLNKEIVAILNKPSFRSRFDGLEIFSSTPEEAVKLIASDHAYWGDVIKRGNIKVE